MSPLSMQADEKRSGTKDIDRLTGKGNIAYDDLSAITSLLEKVDSRYKIATAKRARMLTNGAKKLTDNPSTKDVTIAIEEIAEGKISYHKLQKKANQNIPEDAGHEPEPLESETDQDSE